MRKMLHASVVMKKKTTTTPTEILIEYSMINSSNKMFNVVGKFLFRFYLMVYLLYLSLYH